ncbi:MAG: HutD family protein [Thalassobaculum sp.]|uniref:HutD/Ves family protein n=1 Tax=Thalassobaculum sp. TaxID=2022740 RepID=UPI0032EFA950
MQILRASQHRVMPWKNGGGSTTEIALAPEGAGLDDFDWRISMAVVAADGPFSAFPGVDRTLAVLDGAGLVLHGLPGGPARLGRATPPFGFPADADVAATLPDGPITDLNVMTRRGRFGGRVRRIVETGPVAVAADAAVTLLLAETPCRLAVDGLPPVELGRRDAVRLDGPIGRLALTADGGVEAYLVELTAVA